MSLNMKTLTQALAKTAAVIEKTVQTTVQEVTGPKPLQEYDLIDQIGSGGPGHAWKLYSARLKNRGSAPAQYPIVCVWILDKKALYESRTRAGLSKGAEDTFLDIIRADAARLVRIRHPGVVHVVQGLDENKNAMAMVTEPLFASVANTLGAVENLSKVPKELKGMEMGLLEVKHGLLQIAETLDFLHNNARLIHRAISPETVFITLNGAWKLGGFGFTISLDQASNDLDTISPFHYAEYDVEDSVLPLQPSLNYTSPEWVRPKSSKIGCSSDIFSLGCLAYHLIARKPLLDVHNNIKMYINNLSYLSNETFSNMPSELIADLRRMLSMDETPRPSAMDFTGSPFFRDDTRLRALRFLDHMLERDNMQKTEFLKALSDMWKDFDSRVLRYKVLPPLCAELRNVVMQPMILPMVLTIAETQDRNDFELSTLPALLPVLSSSSGDTLLLLVKHAELIITKTSQEYLISHLLPLLIRAFDDNDARIQEEVLRRTVILAKQLDVQLVKQAIMPRVHGLALKTTVAAVRVNALLCLSDMVSSLDKHAVLDILQTLQRCTAVDRSPPTLMCALGVANSIYKQYGVEFVAEHVLPLLLPLVIAPQLNVQQFGKYILFVKDILRKIEEKRGVIVNYSGASEIQTSSVVNGLHSETSERISGPTSSSKKTNPSWDEDWGPMTKGPSTSSNSQPEPSPSAKQFTPTSNFSSIATVPFQSSSGSQAGISCPAVDIEWPPSSSTSITSQLSNGNKETNQKGSSDPSFDDIDPFANWPPRPTNSTQVLSSTTSSTIGLSTLGYGKFEPNMQTADNTKKSSSSNISIAPSQPYQAMSTSSIHNPNGISVTTNNSIGHVPMDKMLDIGSMFSPSKNPNPTPKIAPPPPSSGRGRGRGRNQGLLRPQPAISQSTQIKPGSQQPPLLDLL